MPITHQVQQTITDGALRISSLAEVTVTASSIVDETIPTPSTDLELSVNITSTSLKSFALWSDQDLTVKTNSSGSPDETFALKANKPTIWLDGMSDVPIAGDVTALYVTNASGTAASLKVLAGWDATP